MDTLCKKCLLPENYAGIKFNEQGICNFCEDYKPILYFGENKLKEDVYGILSNKEKKEYDCIVGFSGGRDSTYLLWYIVTEMKLKPLAVCVENMLTPEETILNIRKTVDLLNVDLVVKKHEYLKKSILHFLNSWVKYPNPATLITLCTGCRLGLSKLIKEEAINRKIPIIIEGSTPFETGPFKKNLISTKRNSNISFILGYGKQIARNPSLISNLSCLKTQINEYIIAPSASIRKHKNDNFHVISPFQKYLRWEEKKIESTIKNKVGWNQHKGLESSYRGDCEVGIIRQYLYYKMLGYNDKDDNLSCLIRDNQISRKDALIRLMNEKETREDTLISSFKKVGIDFFEFISLVEKNAHKHNILYKYCQRKC